MMILAELIDHTNLKPDASVMQIKTLCREAMANGFHAVCVNPVHIKECVVILKGSNIRICSVVGFPLGASTSVTKAFEAEQAESLGANEIDMVMNIGAAKMGYWDQVTDDIAAVVEATSKDIIIKVILETCYLTRKEKIEACLRAVRAGAQYVKTSTGLGPSGATVEDVALLRSTVGPDVGVKAAGGIRDYATALRMIEAGATRIGSSASVEIMMGAPK